MVLWRAQLPLAQEPLAFQLVLPRGPVTLPVRCQPAWAVVVKDKAASSRAAARRGVIARMGWLLIR